MKLKTLLLGVTMAASITAAHADTMNARVKSVDVEAHTFTVIEGGKNYTYLVTGDTKFVNGAGAALVGGLKTDGFKAGTRLSISYAKKDDKSVAAEVKLRDKK